LDINDHPVFLKLLSGIHLRIMGYSGDVGKMEECLPRLLE
jgi:hypothetical protein